MEPVFNQDGELSVPHGVDIPVDKDAVDQVTPEFADFETQEPEQAPEKPEEPAQENAEQPEPEAQAEEPAQEGAEPGAAPGEEPQSSSTSETPVEEPEPQPQPEAELSEEAILDYLSKSLGKEVKNLQDLVQEPKDPFEGDEDLKALVEWRERTGRPLSDYAKYQKDYSAMSDEEAAREYLRHRYPDFTADEVQLELEQYLPSEDDLDNEAARKRLNLKKLAADGRRELDSLRLELNNPLPSKLTEEQQQAIDFYKQSQEQQAKAREIQQINSKNISDAVQSVETLSLNLDKDVSVEFKPDQNARKNLQEFMKMPNWYNQDGTINGSEIVKDSFKLQNFEAIVQEAYKQGLARGEGIIEKTTNNTTLDKDRPTQEGMNPQKNDIQIEGLEDMQGWQPRWGK